MDPQLRRPLYFVLTLAAVGVAIYATLHTDVAGESGDGAAAQLSSAAVRLAVGITIAFIVRAIVRRAPANRTFGTAPAAICCGALIGLAMTGLVLNNKKDARDGATDDGVGTAVSDTRICIEREGDPLGRARAPYTLTQLSAAEREELLSTLSKASTRPLVRFRNVVRDGLLVGRVTAVALRLGTLDGDEYLDTMRQSLTSAGGTARDTKVDGREAIAGEVDGSSVLVGVIDCGALTVETSSRRDTRALWTAISSG